MNVVEYLKLNSNLESCSSFKIKQAKINETKSIFKQLHDDLTNFFFILAIQFFLFSLEMSNTKVSHASCEKISSLCKEKSKERLYF